jgi:gliding motility-associated lipoprotein GldH
MIIRLRRLIRGNQFVFVIAATILLLSSCDSNRVFEENKTIRDYNWDYNLPVTFTVDIVDTLSGHNMYLNVRNAGYYRFSNLFLFVNTILPQGQTLRDTVEITLSAPDGKWLGNGLGDIYDNRYLFRENFKFPQAGSYRFELIQAMRVNPLQGIMDAGIRIEKATK